MLAHKTALESALRRPRTSTTLTAWRPECNRSHTIDFVPARLLASAPNCAVGQGHNPLQRSVHTRVPTAALRTYTFAITASTEYTLLAVKRAHCIRRAVRDTEQLCAYVHSPKQSTVPQKRRMRQSNGISLLDDDNMLASITVTRVRKDCLSVSLDEAPSDTSNSTCMHMWHHREP